MKFEIPSKHSKRAYPRAMFRGQEVRVRGVERLDESRRAYYQVQPVNRRSEDSIKSVRCDKLTPID
jgi:hypothetical protein